MDFTKFRTADWLVIVGGAVVFIAGFLDWFDAGPVSPNAFDFTLTGLTPWLLLTAAAVLAFLAAAGVLPSAAPWPLILLGLTALGAILVLVRLVVGADLSDIVDLAGQPDHSLDRAGALWLSAIGALYRHRRGGDDVPKCGRPPERAARSSEDPRLLQTMTSRPGGSHSSSSRAAVLVAQSGQPCFRFAGLRTRKPGAVAAYRLGLLELTTMSAISSPASVGLRPMRTPADSSASIFPFAVPLPPDTIAPAWPILRPGGAVTPAM